MKKLKKLFLFFVIFGLILCSSFICNGCFYNQSASIISISKTKTVGLVDTYTITFSDGRTSTFTVTNGKNGTDGKNGESLKISEIYQEYVDIYGDISYQDFLKQYLSINENANDNVKVINNCLHSSMKVYTEFIESPSSDTAIYTGSAVIYKMESDYTYIITNYHVVYNPNAASANKSNMARKIVGYLYGSESNPIEKQQKENGFTAYDYGEYGIQLEYIGGTITNDLAVLKAQTSSVLAINPNAKAIKLAKDYYVGETAIAIGNPEDEGISVTEGIVSVDNENIQLAIDNTTRSYRSIRIDTALYTGNSGGGLYNSKGELIGITNAGDTSDQNVNYAIPLQIVQGTVDNILHYYKNDGVAVNAYKIKLGITVSGKNSKYTYNESLGYGKITEDVLITEVENNCIASRLNIQKNDIIKSIIIDSQEYKIDRYFRIADILLKIRVNSSIQFKLDRNGTNITTSAYTITNNNLVEIE